MKKKNYLVITLYPEKDKDIIDWINTIDKEARSYVLKVIIRKHIKSDNTTEEIVTEESELQKKVDSMF